MKGFISFLSAQVFEQCCTNYMWRMVDGEQLPFVPQRIGRWWGREHEIDIVALSQGGEGGRAADLLVAECKWAQQPIGIDVLAVDGLENRRMVRGGTDVPPGVDAIGDILVAGHEPELWVIALGTNDVTISTMVASPSALSSDNVSSSSTTSSGLNSVSADSDSSMVSISS